MSGVPTNEGMVPEVADAVEESVMQEQHRRHVDAEWDAIVARVNSEVSSESHESVLRAVVDAYRLGIQRGVARASDAQFRVNCKCGFTVETSDPEQGAGTFFSHECLDRSNRGWLEHVFSIPGLMIISAFSFAVLIVFGTR